MAKAILKTNDVSLKIILKDKIGDFEFQFLSRSFNRQERLKVFYKKSIFDQKMDSNDESCDHSFTSALTDRQRSLSDLEQLTSKPLHCFPSPFIKEKKLDQSSNPRLKSTISVVELSNQKDNFSKQNGDRKLNKQQFKIDTLQSEISKMETVG